MYAYLHCPQHFCATHTVRSQAFNGRPLGSPAQCDNYCCVDSPTPTSHGSVQVRRSLCGDGPGLEGLAASALNLPVCIRQGSARVSVVTTCGTAHVTMCSNRPAPPASALCSMRAALRSSNVFDHLHLSKSSATCVYSLELRTVVSQRLRVAGPCQSCL
jgi:hypothetical protein